MLLLLPNTQPAQALAICPTGRETSGHALHGATAYAVNALCSTHPEAARDIGGGSLESAQRDRLPRRESRKGCEASAIGAGAGHDVIRNDEGMAEPRRSQSGTPQQVGGASASRRTAHYNSLRLPGDALDRAAPVSPRLTSWAAGGVSRAAKGSKGG